MNAGRAVIGRCPWSIRVQIYTAYMDDVTGNLLSFFVFNKWHAILKCLWDYFRLKQVNALRKVKQELFTKQKNGHTETKRALDHLRMPKLTTRNLHNSCHCVSSLWETCCFAKCFHHYATYYTILCYTCILYLLHGTWLIQHGSHRSCS